MTQEKRDEIVKPYVDDAIVILTDAFYRAECKKGMVVETTDPRTKDKFVLTFKKLS